THVSDGPTTNGWDDRGHWLTYPWDRDPQMRLAKSAGFDDCVEGLMMSSWLGPYAFQSQWYRRILPQGARLEDEVIDGHRCHVVVSTTRSKDTFWFDVKTHQLMKRKGTQATTSDDGTILRQVSRTWLF